MMENTKKRLINEVKKSKNITHFEVYENNVSFMYKEKYLFSLVIPSSYPFYPPKNISVNYNRIQYHNMGNIDIIRQYFKMRCLCCTSFACANNWLPTHSLEKIADEYERYKGIINGSIVIGYIKKQLPDDILHHIVNYLK